jgi:alkylation response protein AidB-like acyl-CoA dehydrogenase
MSSPIPQPNPAILETASELGARFAETAAELDASATFPSENIAELHRRGLLAAAVPPPFGTSVSLVEAVHVVEKIGKGEPSTALVLALQYLFHRPLAELSPESKSWPLRARIARSAVEQGGLINVLRVEHDLGTPVRGGLPATIARRAPGGWSISGSKIYSTGAGHLAWNAVWARSDDPDPLVGAWIVPGGTPGLGVVESWNHLGLRASASHEVTFDDVFVPDDHALDVRTQSQWSEVDATGSPWGLVLFAAIYNGVALAARDWFVDFLRRRKPTNLGAPLATVPRLQQVVGEIDQLLYVNRTLLQSAARAIDRNEAPSPVERTFIKYTVANNSIAAVEKALSSAGNHGLSYDNPLQRHFRDVLCSRIHSPQNDTVLVNAGRSALQAAPTRASAE